MKLTDQIDESSLKKEVPEFAPGDTVKVDLEGEPSEGNITFERIPAPEEEDDGEPSSGPQKSLPPPPA